MAVAGARNALPERLPERMRAVVLHGREDLRVDEVETPRAGEGEVVLRVDAALTCGTDRKQHHLAARPHRIHRRPNQPIPAHRHHHRIRAATLRRRARPRRHVFFARVHRMPQPKPRRNPVPLRIQVRRQHRRARPRCEGRQQNPDRPLPNHQHRGFSGMRRRERWRQWARAREIFAWASG